jgi:prepilin-type N-terminal cleavage/methylation domain-containing protein
VSRVLRRQAGYTLVETIVAMTVGAIVIAAVFPVFLLLYRVETTWANASQARASGLIAEDSLLRDVRVYEVERSEPTLLLLRALGTGPTYSVTYSVKRWIDSSGQLRTALLRTVRDKDGNVLSQRAVAHGIRTFTTGCFGSTLSVSLVVDGSDGTPVPVSPDLLVTPRNLKGCPTP